MRAVRTWFNDPLLGGTPKRNFAAANPSSAKAQTTHLRRNCAICIRFVLLQNRRACLSADSENWSIKARSSGIRGKNGEANKSMPDALGAGRGAIRNPKKIAAIVGLWKTCYPDSGVAAAR